MLDKPSYRKYSARCEFDADCMDDAVVQYVSVDEEESVYLDHRCEQHLMDDEELAEGEWEAREIPR